MSTQAPPTPVLHVLCGKIASGKSTLARRLAEDESAVLITEDEWLGRLYAHQMTTPRDYVRCAGLLRAAVGPHIAALLNAGVSVMLDFQANTVESRTWMRDVLEGTAARCQLNLLEPPAPEEGFTVIRHGEDG